MTAERWQTFSLAEQLAHVGSEVTRARIWQEKNSEESFRQALERALHLLDLTIADSRWSSRLSELTRLREGICDYYSNSKNYNINLRSLEDYCSFSLMTGR
jgi:hypothetical protein